MESFLIFFSIVAAVAATGLNNYCDLNCNIDGTVIEHIACGDKTKFSPDCPENIEILNMDEYFQWLIVSKYNEIRNFVAGGANSSYAYSPACRMATIQWDSELAKLADFKVKRCSAEKDLCHGTVAFPKSGQTVFREKVVHSHRPTGLVLEEFVSELFDDINETSHFGDMLTDSNVRLGCAATRLEHDNSTKTYGLTCNYATEIHDRESMYATCKSAGEDCRTGKNPAYTNLCSIGEKYEQ